MDDALRMYVSQASQQLPQDLHEPHLGLTPDSNRLHDRQPRSRPGLTYQTVPVQHSSPREEVLTWLVGQHTCQQSSGLRGPLSRTSRRVRGQNSICMYSICTPGGGSASGLLLCLPAYPLECILSTPVNYNLRGAHNNSDVRLSPSCYRRGKALHGPCAATYLQLFCWVQVCWSLRLLECAFARSQRLAQCFRCHHQGCLSASTPELSQSTAGPANDRDSETQ